MISANVTGKIVIVEDDDDSREALSTIIESLGYTPLSFSSAQSALDGLKGEDIAVFLLDIMMPKMNGYELLDALRAREEFKKTPVIMVTAKDDDKEVLEGYKHGADYYITKPYTAKQIEFGLNLYLAPEVRE
jgi:two-component system, OmpR family, response regulator ResD